MTIRIAVLAAMTMATVIAASGAQASFKSGNDLLSDCSHEDNLDQGMCLGYVTGVADSMAVPLKYVAKLRNGEVIRARACIRDGVTARQLRDVVVKWLEDNPQLRDMNADSAVELALSGAFPC